MLAKFLNIHSLLSDFNQFQDIGVQGNPQHMVLFICQHTRTQTRARTRTQTRAHTRTLIKHQSCLHSKLSFSVSETASSDVCLILHLLPASSHPAAASSQLCSLLLLIGKLPTPEAESSRGSADDDDDDMIHTGIPASMLQMIVGHIHLGPPGPPSLGTTHPHHQEDADDDRLKYQKRHGQI